MILPILTVWDTRERNTDGTGGNTLAFPQRRTAYLADRVIRMIAITMTATP